MRLNTTHAAATALFRMHPNATRFANVRHLPGRPIRLDGKDRHLTILSELPGTCIASRAAFEVSLNDEDGGEAEERLGGDVEEASRFGTLRGRLEGGARACSVFSMEKIGGERHFEDACKLHETGLQALCGSLALERDGRREPSLLHRQRRAGDPLPQERASRSQKRNGRTELPRESCLLFRSEGGVASGLAEPGWGDDVLGARAASGDLRRGAYGRRGRSRERLRHLTAVHRWIYRAFVGHGGVRERIDKGLGECVAHLDLSRAISRHGVYSTASAGSASSAAEGCRAGGARRNARELEPDKRACVHY
jgi:hypothetical protein